MLAWGWVLVIVILSFLSGFQLGGMLAAKVVEVNLRAEGWSKEAIKRKCFKVWNRK